MCEHTNDDTDCLDCLNDPTRLQGMIDDLEEAAEAEGTEIGEYWQQFASLYPRIMDTTSKTFRDAWLWELEELHSDLKNNWEYNSP